MIKNLLIYVLVLLIFIASGFALWFYFLANPHKPPERALQVLLFFPDILTVNLDKISVLIK